MKFEYNQRKSLNNPWKRFRGSKISLNEFERKKESYKMELNPFY